MIVGQKQEKGGVMGRSAQILFEKAEWLQANPPQHFEIKRKLEYSRIPGQEAFDSGPNTSVIR